MCIASENVPGMGSNNHIATGRYLKLLGILLRNIKQKPSIEFPPSETQHTWNKSLNIEWLWFRYTWKCSRNKRQGQYLHEER